MAAVQKFLRKIPCGITSVVVLLLILYATLFPNPIPIQEKLVFFEGFDKVVHFLMFFCLTIALLFDYQKKAFPQQAKTRISLGFMGAAVALGALTEMLQEVMGLGRTEDINDFITDAIGAFVAWLLWYYIFDKYLRSVFKAGMRHRHHHHQE